MGCFTPGPLSRECAPLALSPAPCTPVTASGNAWALRAPGFAVHNLVRACCRLHCNASVWCQCKPHRKQCDYLCRTGPRFRTQGPVSWGLTNDKIRFRLSVDFRWRHVAAIERKEEYRQDMREGGLGTGVGRKGRTDRQTDGSSCGQLVAQNWTDWRTGWILA